MPKFGGPAVLSDTTPGASVMKADGQPAAVRFTVYDHSTGRRVAGGISNADGTWNVDNLNPARYYFVRVEDRTRQLNGAVLDWLQPTTPSP